MLGPMSGRLGLEYHNHTRISLPEQSKNLIILINRDHPLKRATIAINIVYDVQGDLP